MANGCFANREPVGDVLVLQGRSDQSDHLALAFAELVDPGKLRGEHLMSEAVQQRARKPILACADLLDSFQKYLDCLFSKHHTCRAVL